MPMGRVSVVWSKKTDPNFSECCYTDGFVIIDAGAGAVISGDSPLQPTPQTFLTGDFVEIFGTSVPKCGAESIERRGRCAHC